MRYRKKLLAILLAITTTISIGLVSYADEVPQEAPVEAPQPTQQQIEDAVILSKILELQALYPQGTAWGMGNTYKTINKGRINGGTVYACQAFAYLVQDYAFGAGHKVKGKATGLEQWVNKNLLGVYGSWSASLVYYPETGDFGAWEVQGYDGSDPTVNANFEKIYANLRVGDIVQDVYHMVVVLSKDETGITVAEGNNNGMVKYGRRITKESLRRSLIRVETMY